MKRDIKQKKKFAVRLCRRLFIILWLICTLLAQFVPPSLIIETATTLIPDRLEPVREAVAETLAELLPEPAIAYAQNACGTAPDDLGGTIWQDYNSNGMQDAGELGFDGVTVTAYDNDGNAMTTTVNADGTYNFSNIFATETHIRLEFSGLPDWMESGVLPN